MAALTLKSLLSPKAGASSSVAALVAAMGGKVGIEDASGRPLVGALSAGPSRVPVTLEDATLGWVDRTARPGRRRRRAARAPRGQGVRTPRPGRGSPPPLPGGAPD